MGMSQDYKLAVKHGSNTVRIGRAILNNFLNSAILIPCKIQEKKVETTKPTYCFGMYMFDYRNFRSFYYQITQLLIQIQRQKQSINITKRLRLS